MAKLLVGREAGASWRDDDFDDDGLFEDTRRRVHTRRTAQLCACAERALRSAIERELEDDWLDGLTLLEVCPYPDASHLLVIVSAPPGADPRVVQSRLGRTSGRLRMLLGRAIARKRVPSLTFAVLPEGTFDAI